MSSAVIIITDGDEQRLRDLAPHSLVALIFIHPDLSPRRIKELAPVAGRSLALGGTAILATSLEEAWERL